MKRKTRKQTSDDTIAKSWGYVPPENTQMNIDPDSCLCLPGGVPL
jgi:hypothetical protein